eukprot:gene16894-22383_t
MIDHNEEGLVVKNYISPYVIGLSSRSTEYWVKVKPEYGYFDELDCIVLAGYYGAGTSFRGQGISRFLCGVLDDNNKCYKTFCKVGTGYSFDELQIIRDHFVKYGKLFDYQRPPEFLQNWTIGKVDDRPDMYINPADSFVIQVKCSSIVESNQFSVGYTCRFPRVVRLRSDKSIHDILTLNELLLIKDNIHNRTANNADELVDKSNGISGLEPISKRKRKATPDKSENPKVKVKNTVDSAYTISRDIVPIQGHIFTNVIFCIFATEGGLEYKNTTGVVEKYTREELIKSIQEQGGVVVGNPCLNCLILVDLNSSKTLRVSSYINSNEYDVIDVSYVIECLQKNSKLPLKGKHYYGYSKITKEKLRHIEDLFGDSYCDEIDIATLQSIINDIPNSLAIAEKKINSNLAIGNSKSKPTVSKAAKNKVTSHDSYVDIFEEKLVIEDMNALRSFRYLH